MLWELRGKRVNCLLHLVGIFVFVVSRVAYILFSWSIHLSVAVSRYSTFSNKDV